MVLRGEVKPAVRVRDLDALAEEVLLSSATASCASVGVLRLEPGDFFTLRVGLAGKRQFSRAQSEALSHGPVEPEDAKFALEVFKVVCAGDGDALIGLMAPEALQQITESQWRAVAESTARCSFEGEPWLVGKEDGWILVRRKMASHGLMEFKVALDVTRRKVTGMLLGQATSKTLEPLAPGRVVSEEEEALALDVVNIMLAGRQDALVAMLAPETLKAIPESKWRDYAVSTAATVTEGPSLEGKLDGWLIIPVRTCSKRLVFKVAVDVSTGQLCGLTHVDEMPSIPPECRHHPGRAHESEPTSAVQLADCWHLGSCTKSITATLAAVLVEKGHLSWELTVAEALKSDALLAMQSGYTDVTLEMLLTNRGGCWNVCDPAAWAYAWTLDSEGRSGLSRREQRRRYFAKVLALAPHTVGMYEYSNDGFALAGVMMETMLETAWEDLVQREIFDPLDMTTAGFYAMGANATDRTERRAYIWGTRDTGEAVDPAVQGADNPAAIGPAGVIHCSLQDIARYLAVHASHDCAERKLGLSQATWRRLHSIPVNADYPYAFGWLIANTGGSIQHGGCNTTNFMHLKVWPERGLAVVATLNMGLAATSIAPDMAERAVAMTEPVASPNCSTA